MKSPICLISRLITFFSDKKIPNGIKNLYICGMPGKAAITSKYIIETVAPVFNRSGYAGTSMSDLTKATGLTKGAIYGNFKNKEHLAIEAFNYNVRKVIWKLADRMNAVESASEKFAVMTNFYREYYDYTMAFGGCPILNVGIDSKDSNPELYARVVVVLSKLKKNLEQIVVLGIEQGEFKEDLDPVRLGGRMVSMIQGAIFSSILLKDKNHLLQMMDHFDAMVKDEMMK